MFEPGATTKKLYILSLEAQRALSEMQTPPGLLENFDKRLLLSTLPTISRLASSVLAVPEYGS
jgi:hypothetical protein